MDASPHLYAPTHGHAAAHKHPAPYEHTAAHEHPAAHVDARPHVDAYAHAYANADDYPYAVANPYSVIDVYACAAHEYAGASYGHLAARDGGTHENAGARADAFAHQPPRPTGRVSEYKSPPVIKGFPNRRASF